MIIGEVRDLGNGHCCHVQTNGRHAIVPGVKREQREVVLLGVGKVFLGLPDGGDGLVNATDGCLLQPTHRATLINDNQIVDLCFLGVNCLFTHVLVVVKLLVHNQYGVNLLIIVCLMLFIG